MTDLTPFQDKCGAELKRVLRKAGYEVCRWEAIKGQHETYVEVDLGPVKIWIYADGACWQGLGRDRVFEAPDYNSLDHLQQAFLAEVSAALNQASERGQ